MGQKFALFFLYRALTFIRDNTVGVISQTSGESCFTFTFPCIAFHQEGGGGFCVQRQGIYMILFPILVCCYRSVFSESSLFWSSLRCHIFS